MQIMVARSLLWWHMFRDLSTRTWKPYDLLDPNVTALMSEAEYSELCRSAARIVSEGEYFARARKVDA